MPLPTSKLIAATVLAAGLTLASGAHATWTFTSATTSSNDSASAPNISTIGGYYVTNSATNAGFATGATWTASALSYNNPGLGMSSDSTQSPQHAIDNNGRTEAVLVGFQSSVVLSSIGLSWTFDSMTQGQPVDVSLFRYTGSGTPPTLSSTTMSGWELVGNYGDMAQDTTIPFTGVNSTNKGSSWWLISAYNSGFTGAKESRSSLDNGSDYFKIYALAGSACVGNSATCANGTTAQVAEPASLALVGVALAGVLGSAKRRRRSGVSA